MLPLNISEYLFGHTADIAEYDADATTDYLNEVENLPFSEATGRDVTTYFADGTRKIDYVLVYRYEAEEPKRVRKAESLTEARERRKTYINNLHETGVDIEQMEIDTGTENIFFVKIHVPWELLVQYAELLTFRVPFKEKDRTNFRNISQYHWSYPFFNAFNVRIFNTLAPDRQKHYFTCEFKRDKLKSYIGSDDKQTFFKTIQRNIVAYEILQETVYGDNEHERGLDQLLNDGVFSDAFPLHDGPHQIPSDSVKDDFLNQRQTLYYYWARWIYWQRYQPLNHIQIYFGEKTAFYFAWIGLYTSWLFPLAIIGLIVFIGGALTVESSAIVEDVCTRPLISYTQDLYKKFVKIPLPPDLAKKPGKVQPSNRRDPNITEPEGQNIMCPICNECDYWELNRACINYAIAYVTDHPGTVFYAIFTSLWAVLFLQNWKRLQNRLSYSWDCYDIVNEEERPRASYIRKAPEMGVNPVTGLSEPTYPTGTRRAHFLITFSVVALMMMVVAIFFIGVMLYRIFVSRAILKKRKMENYAEYGAVLTGYILHFLAVKLLNKIYGLIALWLTEWEVHRTQTEFDNNLTIKMVLFESINNYTPQFYVAFIKGRFMGYPGHYNTLFGARLEQCDNDNCASELALNVCVFFIGNLVLNNIGEYFWPIFKGWISKRNKQIKKYLETVQVSPQWMEDYCLHREYNVWADFMEMVTQFGFVTIFVAAFPMAPFLALINNCLEIRLDAKKYLIYSRRALAQRVKDIGIWYPIMKIIVYVSVLTNACIIAFTLDFLPKMLYMYERGTWDLHGYVAFTMAYSKEFHCRYHDLRDADGKLTLFYWKLLFIRVLFIILFEHFIFLVMKAIQLFVPDMPTDVDIQIKRERYLAKQTFTLTAQKK